MVFFWGVLQTVFMTCGFQGKSVYISNTFLNILEFLFKQFFLRSGFGPTDKIWQTKQFYDFWKLVDLLLDTLWKMKNLVLKF